MSTRLVQTLVQAALSQNDTGPAESSLSQAASTEWERLPETLEMHRLAPITGWAIDRCGLKRVVADNVRAQVEKAYRQTLLTNTVLLHTLGRVLDSMAANDVQPVVWKGVVLADSFYPDLGSRWMGDIDFSIEPHEVDGAIKAFEAVGFRKTEGVSTDDALYFDNELGVVFDVHHRVRLFEGRDLDSYTMMHTAERGKVPPMRVLDPDAMLAHLIVHLEGHRDEMGYLMSWLLDIVYVLRKWGDRLDVTRLNGFFPENSSMVTLLRIARFFRDEFGETPPACFASAVRTVEPLTLDEVLRRRRLAQWELNGVRGWARLGACRLGWPKGERSFPLFKDLIQVHADAKRERRILSQAPPRIDGLAA